MKHADAQRYAIYWAPAADHALWRAGCEWLGRDAESCWRGADASHRAQPRRYGFHATLKPPFALAPEVSPSSLIDAIAALASEASAFDMPALAVAPLGDFIALRPRERVAAAHPLRRLADDCVRRLDPLRRPPDESETARRMHPGLSPAQRANVERWGYPHVFDEWRFHMSLTDSLASGPAGDALRASLQDDARDRFRAALAQPLRCDGVALFVEDAPGADLRLDRRFGFAS